jgi:EmrB/QacA subfamily drug resistance transporter
MPPATSEARRWWVLAAATLALGMMTIDTSIVRVALPTVQRELDASDVSQQWIVNAYLLTMGTFAIVGGRAGDLFGRRRVFLAGVVIFISGSVLSGLAPSTGVLITARAIQGFGAAIMTPGNVAMVTDAFAGRSLGRPMGVLTGVGSIGVSLGSLVGGMLITLVDWRWIFFINVPISLAVLAIVIRYVPERRLERPPGLDLPGLVSLAIGMTAVTVGLMEAPSLGWASVATIGLLAVGLMVLYSWLRIEARRRDPLVDPAVLRGPMLGANFVAFCVPFVLTGLSVLLAIYLQTVLGFSALETGALMLPMTIPMFAGSLIAGWLLSKIGSRTLVTGGMFGAGIGVFLVGVGASTGDGYLPLLPGIVIFGFGGAVALPSMTAAIMASATDVNRGMVSGVYNTARLVGGTIGLAVIGSMLATFESAKLNSDEASGNLNAVAETHVHNLLAGGRTGEEALNGLSASEAHQLQEDARRVFDASFAATMKLSALVAIAGAVVAYRVIPRLRGPATAEIPVEGQIRPEA